MIELIDPEVTFVDAELLDGDILCVQYQLLPEDMDKLEDPTVATVPGYFERLANRVIVPFRNKIRDPSAAHQEDLKLVLSKKMTYDQVRAVSDIGRH